MIIYFILIPILYIPVKIVLYYIVYRFGKFSYDGLGAFGFAYNSKKDLFYSTKDAWQKKFGYCHLYDVGAPIFNMIIDTEPIKFNYNNKNYLLTFWKGQYGMTTGCEIGIYSTTQRKVNKKTVYYPVTEDEMLDMSFVLYKKGEVIARESAKHWWLAIFKLGMFSKPKDLVMDISITFPNEEMLDSFVSSFKKLKHSKKSYWISDNTFYFTFKKPKTRKVWTRSLIADAIRQKYNRRNVNLYNKYLSDVIDNNGIDDSKTNNKMIILNNIIPNILKNNHKAKFILNKKSLADIEIDSTNNIIFLNDSIYTNLKRKNI